MSTSADPYLVELAKAAESGFDCHYVRLLIGSSVIVGKPCSFEDFAEAMIPPMKRETWDLTGREFGTRAIEERTREQKFREKTEARAAMMREGTELHGPFAMTLREVQFLPSSGDGLKLPAIRVSLESVDGWWVAGGEAIPTARGSGGFFVGGVFSLGDG